MLKVGTGKTIINFPQSLFPFEDFCDIHDDLYVRVVIFKNKIDFAIATFELTSLRPYAIEAFKNIIIKKTGIKKENIWICVTHTFSAPHTRSKEALKQVDAQIVNKNTILCQCLQTALVKALDLAINNLDEVMVGFTHGYCSVNVNRDVHTAKGWWLGANDLEASDKTVPIIRFDSLKGHPRLIIYSCDVQSSIMDHSYLEDGTRLITGDLTGIASQYIESQYDEDFVAMMIVGAAGDQAPIFKASHNIVDRLGNIHEYDIGIDGFVFVNALGKKLGTQIVQVAEKISTKKLQDQITYQQDQISCPGQKLPINIAAIKPTHIYEYQDDQSRDVQINILTIGYIAIVAVAPELSSTTAMEIKKQSPYPLTMVVTMVNGGAKYMPDQTAYDRITYEAMNSMFARGSAEILSNKIIQLLKEMEIRNENRTC